MALFVAFHHPLLDECRWIFNQFQIIQCFPPFAFNMCVTSKLYHISIIPLFSSYLPTAPSTPICTNKVYTYDLRPHRLDPKSRIENKKKHVVIGAILYKRRRRRLPIDFSSRASLGAAAFPRGVRSWSVNNTSSNSVPVLCVTTTKALRPFVQNHLKIKKSLCLEPQKNLVPCDEKKE